ncbi:AbfB domain-containing protein [Amycolatopsis sp. CM201R]|nr:AbfB domain-containing protein [Amycolatopsis sp. 505]MDS0145513.1 AbfB domain-containing protein [Amycolatopsis sp. CM201R]
MTGETGAARHGTGVSSVAAVSDSGLPWWLAAAGALVVVVAGFGPVRGGPCPRAEILRPNDAGDQVVLSAVDSAGPATTNAEATWIVRAGLANCSCLTFESADQPSRFLRHYAFRLRLNADDALADPDRARAGDSPGGRRARSPTVRVDRRRHRRAAVVRYR